MVTTYKTYDMGTTTIKIPKWDIEEETGYKPITTFWMDFSIADLKYAVVEPKNANEFFGALLDLRNYYVKNKML